MKHKELLHRRSQTEPTTTSSHIKISPKNEMVMEVMGREKLQSLVFLGSLPYRLSWM